MNDEFKIELKNELLNTMQSLCKRILQREQAANESTIPLNEITSQIPPLTPVLLTMEPKDSLITGDENLSTIPKKESDEFIKSSVEDLVSIPSEFGDTSDNDSECDLPSYDDFSPINIPEGSVTFSNPLFDSNDDFTSSDDESLSDEDVLQNNVKIYSNPLFEFDNEYISSDVNLLFDEVLENIESGDVDEIELLLHHNPSTLKISIASILEGFIDEPPFEENDDLFWNLKRMNGRRFFFLPYFTYPVESLFLLSSGRLPQILKTLVLVVLSIVHSIFNPWHAYLWESDILDLID
ncbi:hypothetical protein Tco_1334142 [Tanacetum coccineum]